MLDYDGCAHKRKFRPVIPAKTNFTYPARNQRVRAILLTEANNLLFIKRVKPNKPAYHVAPGGGVEDEDMSLLSTLYRELDEELGATIDVLKHAFILLHEKAGKNLEEHFFICRLTSMDLSRRHGPEFDDPSRGQYIPEEIPLHPDSLNDIEIKTPELRDYLLDNLDELRLTGGIAS